MPSKWLDWTPDPDKDEIIEEKTVPQSLSPSELSFDGFEGPRPGVLNIIQAHNEDTQPGPAAIEKEGTTQPSKPSEPLTDPTPPLVAALDHRGNSWPPESVDAERRIAQPHAKLFPFIGRKVRTPDGPGTLIQVFAERVTVILDSELSKCAAFHPEEIEPVCWELA
jgi:hypothetical protein